MRENIAFLWKLLNRISRAMASEVVMLKSAGGSYRRASLIGPASAHLENGLAKSSFKRQAAPRQTSAAQATHLSGAAGARNQRIAVIDIIGAPGEKHQRRRVSKLIATRANNKIMLANIDKNNGQAVCPFTFLASATALRAFAARGRRLARRNPQAAIMLKIVGP